MSPYREPGRVDEDTPKESFWFRNPGSKGIVCAFVAAAAFIVAAILSGDPHRPYECVEGAGRIQDAWIKCPGGKVEVIGPELVACRCPPK